MHNPLVCQELLAKSDKILFFTQLAIGDFTYLQNCFAQFSRLYPHIKIHVFVEERHRTWCFWRWKHLKKYAIYDWLAACPFIEKVYNQTYSPISFNRSIHAACKEKYPLVVSLAATKPHKAARMIRKISPNGFVVGLKHATASISFVKQLAYRNLDAFYTLRTTQANGQHVSAVFAQWFYELFGFYVEPADRFPFVSIPEQWHAGAKQWILDQSMKQVQDMVQDDKIGDGVKIVFINPYAKCHRRCWPLEHVAELIKTVQSFVRSNPSRRCYAAPQDERKDVMNGVCKDDRCALHCSCAHFAKCNDLASGLCKDISADVHCSCARPEEPVISAGNDSGVSKDTSAIPNHERIHFIINVIPEKLNEVHAFFKTQSLSDIVIFSAEQNFFQLPAIMSLCDIVVSVETSTMHLAAALNIPQIVLMRLNNPEWFPLSKNICVTVTTKERGDFVSQIPSGPVADALLQMINHA